MRPIRDGPYLHRGHARSDIPSRVVWFARVALPRAMRFVPHRILRAAAELEQCSPSSQFAWQTEAAQKGFPEHEVTRLRVFVLFWSVRAMPGQKKKLPRALRVTARSLESLLRRFGLADEAGALGEHCSSSAADRVLCGLSGRVAQPPLHQPIRRNPEGAARQGALLFGTFILGKQNKDTSCRAAPDKSINCAWNAHHTLRI